MKQLPAVVAAIVGLALSAVSAQTTQPGAGTSPLESGRAIYAAQCAFCHRPNGAGLTPSFPALAANARLGDADFVVLTIHHGRGGMPAFPHLGAEEVAAVASYIRTSWGNDFGRIAAVDVVTAAEGTRQPAAAVSVWNGVFSQSQSERGRQVLRTACAECHGTRLDGAPLDPDRTSTPPLARARFLRVWEGRSVAALFAFTRATMPPSSPGSLRDDEYMDAIAHMLAVSSIPSGAQDLPVEPDRLGLILIRTQPAR